MSKLLVVPSNIDEINKTKSLCDGYIIGIDGMSIGTNMLIRDLSILKSINDKDIFISLNKNMHNSDLDKLESILIELNNYNIKGVLYYDIAVMNIYRRHSFNYELVWNQEHAVTNYNTINYWYDFGVNYAYLSSDITEDEIVTISKKCKSKLIINVFGYLPMFVSKRHIVKNYLGYFNLCDSSKINYISKEGKKYPIVDNDLGTICYSNNILNGLESYVNVKASYYVLNSFNIEANKFIEVLKIFKKSNKKNFQECNNEIYSLFSNIDSGFLNKKTIYKVKK